MTPPTIMCRQHLLGEHVEIHMFVGALRKGTRMGRFVTDHLLEFGSLRSRHAELVSEMERRGYEHKSPFPAMPSCKQVSKEERAARIPREASLAELLRRCPQCAQLFATQEPPNLGRFNCAGKYVFAT